jgi:hypothetical protein
MTKRDLRSWDLAVTLWRTMLAGRPLGPCYEPPSVEIPEELAIRPKRYGLPRDYPLAFWTMDSVARGA